MNHWKRLLSRHGVSFGVPTCTLIRTLLVILVLFVAPLSLKQHGTVPLSVKSFYSIAFSIFTIAVPIAVPTFMYVRASPE
jgi:hypothetical protein